MKKLILAFIALFLLFSIYSCGPATITVTDRPAAPYGVRPGSPGIGYVWIDGDWYWSGGRYVYRDGYWSRPRGHRVWHTGDWQRRGNGWYWRKGRWH
jgi:WXXGXW repeat (2 copies)